MSALSDALPFDKMRFFRLYKCSISFDGKSTAEFNADMCLFLEQWKDERSELRAYGST